MNETPGGLPRITVEPPLSRAEIVLLCGVALAVLTALWILFVQPALRWAGVL